MRSPLDGVVVDIKSVSGDGLPSLKFLIMFIGAVVGPLALLVIGGRDSGTLSEIGLALRTNGVAGFGYLSGWFRRVGNEKIFCAVSQGPLWLLTFEGSAGCRQLALSASAETVRRIEEWARQG